MNAESSSLLRFRQDTIVWNHGSKLTSTRTLLRLQLFCLMVVLGMTASRAEDAPDTATLDLGGKSFNQAKPIRISEGFLFFSHESGVGKVRLDTLSLKTLLQIAAEDPSIGETPDFLMVKDTFLPSLIVRGTTYTGLRLRSMEGGTFKISTDSGEISCQGNELSIEDQSALLQTMVTFESLPTSPTMTPDPGPGPGFVSTPGGGPVFGLTPHDGANTPAPGRMSFNPFSPSQGEPPVTIPPPPQYQNLLVDTPPNPMVIPLAPSSPGTIPIPESTESSGVTDTSEEGPGNDTPEDEWSLLGSWRFKDGTVRVFKTDIPEELQRAVPLKGEIVNADGAVEGYWSQPNEFEGPSVPWPTHANQLYLINFAEGLKIPNDRGEPISGTVLVSLNDPGYLLGKAEHDAGDTPTIRARKIGFAPVERSVTSKSPSPTSNSSTPKVEVDRDYLRLIKAVSDPWTDDPLQAEDCTQTPLVQIERRMGEFDGGTNPEMRELVAAIVTGRERIESAERVARERIAQVESDFDETANRTTTFSGTDINGNLYSRTEVTGTTFGDVLGNMFFSAAARTGGEANIRSEQEALAYEYWKTNLKLAEVAPRIYSTAPPRSQLVKVRFSKDGFVIENVAGHALTDLTVRIDLYHFSMVPKRYGCRLYFSPNLNAGEKRYASIAQLQIDPEKPHPYEIEWRPDRRTDHAGTGDEWLVSAGGICEMRVFAWSSEGRQEVEIQRFPDAAKRGAAYEAKLVQGVLSNPSSDRYELSVQRRFLELASKRILQLDPSNSGLATIATGTLERLGVPLIPAKEWEFETDPAIDFAGYANEPREWRDIDGRTIVATFVQMNEQGLVIAMESGERFTIPLDRLDAASRSLAIRLSRQ